MSSDYTTNQNLGRYTGTQNPSDVLTDNTDNLEHGRSVYVNEFGEAVDKYEVIYKKDSDSKWYLAQADTSGELIGIAFATDTEDSYASGEDGHAWGPGAVFENASWSWTKGVFLYLSDTPGALSESAGTNPIIVAYSLTDTEILVLPPRPGHLTLEGVLSSIDTITLLEKSADPSEPSEGEAVIWLSDGTGKGDDGDVLVASQAGGTTKYGTLFDHSGGSAW
jgi:hypothetical protein